MRDGAVLHSPNISFFVSAALFAVGLVIFMRLPKLEKN